MEEGPVTRALTAGGRTYGLMMFELATLGAPRLADSAGADFVIWDLQQTGWTIDTVRRLLAAARLGRAWPLVRVAGRDDHLLATALAAGAMGVVVPGVETADQANAVVRAVKEPPLGNRRSRSIYPDAAEPASAGAPLAIVQIDTPAGADNAEEIAATPGVDAVWVAHPEEPSADGVVAAAAGSGKPAGMVARSVSDGVEALARGFRWVALADVQLYHAALADLVAGLREAASETAST